MDTLAGSSDKAWEPPAWADADKRETVSTAADKRIREAIREHFEEAGRPWYCDAAGGSYSSTAVQLLWYLEQVVHEEAGAIFPPPEEPPGRGEHCIYRHWTSDGILLYVGYTADFGARQRAHSRSATWWPEAYKVAVERFDTRDEALLAELTAIRTEHPLWNVQGQTR